MKRRQMLKGGAALAGTAVLGGLGTVALTGTGLAASATINSDPVYVSNDDGTVRKVYIDPEIDVNWEGFDDAVGAVSIFIEGKVDGGPTGPNPGGFFPLHRSEVPLTPGQGLGRPKTTSSVTVGPFSSMDGARADDKGWGSGLSPDGRVRIADAEHDVPDYDYSTQEGYLEGANVYSGTIPDGEPLVNGEYGLASTADPFNVETGGREEKTPVRLRYTIQLLELGLNHFETITNTDFEGWTIGEVKSWLDEHYDSANARWVDVDNASFLEDVKPDDITLVAVDDNGDYTTADEAELTWERNQKLLANVGPGGDDHPMPGFWTSRHASKNRSYESSHDAPMILVDSGSGTDFSVFVENLDEAGGSDGDSSTGAS